MSEWSGNQVGRDTSGAATRRCRTVDGVRTSRDGNERLFGEAREQLAELGAPSGGDTGSGDRLFQPGADPKGRDSPRGDVNPLTGFEVPHLSCHSESGIEGSKIGQLYCISSLQAYGDFLYCLIKYVRHNLLA